MPLFLFTFVPLCYISLIFPSGGPALLYFDLIYSIFYVLLHDVLFGFILSLCVPSFLFFADLSRFGLFCFALLRFLHFAPFGCVVLHSAMVCSVLIGFV